MSNAVRVSSSLIRAAKIFGEENNRSLANQIEQWALIGLELERKEKGPLTSEEAQARFGVQVGDESGTSISEEKHAAGLPVVGSLDDDDPTVYIFFPSGAIEEYAEHKLNPDYVPG